MKKLYTLLLAIASLTLILASCEKKQPVHQPGEPDEAGCYGVYFPSQVGSKTLDPSDPTTATFTVARTNTSGAITVPYTVTGDTEVITASEISFADGQSETTCDLSFSTAEVGVSYTVSFVISDPLYASKYGTQAIAFDYTVMRDKWNSLGKAKFTDTWMFSTTYEAELIQNDNDPTLFRLVDPYSEGLVAEGYYPDYYKAGPSPYIQFKLLKKGNTLAGQTITQSDLVYFNTFYTGYYHTGYAAEVKCYHPSSFTSYQAESYWTYNKVLQYQDNGLPAGVQLAPFYYMDGVGGWDYSQDDGVITIIFPGAVLTDYSLEMEAGLSNKGKLPVNFALGTDVAKVKYAIYEGALNAAQIEARAAAIIDGTQTGVKTVSESGVTEIEMDTTGVYTLVGVTFDKEDGAQEYESITFSYVAKDDEVPVVIKAGLTSTNKYEPYGYNSDSALEFYVFGEDITSAKLALFKSAQYTKDPEGCVEALLDEDAVSAEELADINEYGYCDAFVKLSPGTEYTLLVWATNNYESKVISASAKTTGKLEITIADIVGNYNASATSYFDGPITTTFVIAESDDATKGDIMFTRFIGIPCSPSIYAELDLENNKIIIPDYQEFYTNTSLGCKFYYVTYDGTDATSFDITNVGAWGSPSGMFGVHMVGGEYDDYTYEALTAVDAVRVTASSASITPSYVVKREVVSGDVSCVTAYRPESKIDITYEPKSVSFEATPSSMSRMAFHGEVVSKEVPR